MIAAVMAACGGPVSGPTALPEPTGAPPTVAPTSSPNPTATATPTPVSTDAPTSAPTPTAPPTNTPTPEPPVVIVARVEEGSEARYRVREQFADRDFPNDAVGETSDVSGSLVFNSDGTVQSDQSMLVVDLRTLRSDDDDRDDYLLGKSLESERFPLAEFLVLEAPGLPWPLPQDGEVNFQLVGNMTLHDTTSPLTWEVTAQFGPGQITGLASTSFTFSTFRMVRPSRFFLLSVEDNIRLEIDFVVCVEEVEAGPG